MQAYKDLVQEVLLRGTPVATRAKLRSTGQNIDATSLFGRQVRFDLSQSFPAITVKRLPFRGVATELLWFIKGSTNLRWLQEQGVTIWDEWDKGGGELGPVYGKQWRSWGTPDGGSVDQLAQVIKDIREDNLSARRRLIVSAWNVADIPQMALPPCHTLFQFSTTGGRLSCLLYQRSADLFLGVPFNIASYALLTCMVAQVTGLQPGELIHTFGDLHLYLNHLPQAEELLRREPKQPPKLWLNPNIREIDDFKPEDIRLVGYESHPALPGEVAI